MNTASGTVGSVIATAAITALFRWSPSAYTPGEADPGSSR